MEIVRAAIETMQAEGRSDADILATISNRPTPAQLAELQANTAGNRPAKAMANLVQSIIDEVNEV